MTLPRSLLKAAICVAPFFVCAVISSAQPTITASETAATGITNCGGSGSWVYPPGLTAFLPTASAVWFDFLSTGGNAGDQYQIQWFEPNGTLYTTDSNTQSGTGGNWCNQWFIDIAGFPPAGVLGTWTVKLIWNGTQIDSTQFAIAPVCTNFSMAPGYPENALISNESTSVNWSFVSTPAFCAWTAAGDSLIQTITPSSGSAGTNITATFLTNNTTSVEVDTVTLTSGSLNYTLYVTRNPSSCAFTPSPPSLNFTAAGGTQQLTVTSNLAVCEWFLQTAQSWLTVPSQLQTGSQTLNITASPNSGPALVGALNTYGLASNNLTIPVSQADSVVISSLLPSSATAGGPTFTLTVNGSGFASLASVQWNGSALTTMFVTSGQLKATVPAALIVAAGTPTITVVSGGLTSNGLSFTINSPPPAITSLNPTSVTVGGPTFTLTVNGSGFLSSAIVQWNSVVLSAVFVNSGQLMATVPAAFIVAPETVSITVVSGGLTSNGVNFAVNSPTPVLTSLNPASATAGGAAFLLTVNGNSFASGASVQWNGSALPMQTLVNSGQLTATVPVNLIAAAGTATITVVSNGVTSNGLSFAINNPAPVLTSLSPGGATAGGPAFTLTVNGSGFLSGASVLWNGVGLQGTSLVNAGQLTVPVPVNLIATAGTATVSVVSGGITSNSVNFPITTGCTSPTATPSVFTFGSGGGNGTVNFNTVCQWTATSNQPWVTLPVPPSGTGPSISFTVQPNSGATQQATLSITTTGNSGTLTVKITQTGSTPGTGLVCTYSITDSAGGVSRSFTSGGGTGAINVVTAANCPWTATPSSSFITISGGAQGTGIGSVNYSVAANATLNPLAGAVTIAGLAYVINELPPGSPSYSCSVNTVTAAPIRPEGFSEKVADLVFTCGGQAPPGGLTGDIRLSFNTGVTNIGITNLLLGSGQTDALLLEDEPTAANLTLGTNAFRGIISPANGVSAGAILFPGVPLASGGTINHTWRITNARVNAQGLASGGGVQATISILSTSPFDLTGLPQTAAMVSSASTFSIHASSTVSGQTTQPVSFVEGFDTAFEPKLAANQYPSQAGTVYNSESGYVNTNALGAQTGFATSGTRLIVSIASVPSGVSVYAPVAPASGTNAELVSADATGAGGSAIAGTSQFNGASYQQVTLTAGAGTATWEVTTSNPSAVETLTFNLLLVNPNNSSLAGIAYLGALAPVTSCPATGSCGAALPSATSPVPRFASSSIAGRKPAAVSLNSSLVSQPQGALALNIPSSCQTAGNVGTTNGCTDLGVQLGNSSPGSSSNSPPDSGTASDLSGSLTLAQVVGQTVSTSSYFAGCGFQDTLGTCVVDPDMISLTYTYPALDSGTTTILNVQVVGTGTMELNCSVASDSPNSDPTSGACTTDVPFGLTVSSTHASNFTQGQNGQYTLTVTNGGPVPTTQPVTVTDIVPAPLTLVSMSAPGTPWTCSGNTCSRTGALQHNGSFEPITVTVGVPLTASGSVTNNVVLSAGPIQVPASDQTNINVLPTVSSVTSSTPDGTYGGGNSISIQVTFSAAVTVTGSPQLALNSGGTADYSSGSGTATLTFTYIVGGSDSSTHLDYTSAGALTLNNGAINAILTLPAPGSAGSLGANKNIAIGSITVNPVVTNVTSTTVNGTYAAGSSISIQVTFSAAVTATGSPQLALNSGGVANYTSGSGSTTLTFIYTVGAGDSSAHLDYTSSGALSLHGGTLGNVSLTLPAPGTAGSLGANTNFVINTSAPVGYSDFGTNNSFSTNSWCVSGPNNADCGPSVTRYIAAPFTAGQTFTLSSITLALANHSGTNGAIVTLLNGTPGGLPGTVTVESWTVSNLPSDSQPVITSVSSKVNPILVAGQTYWVEVQGAAADTMDVWYTNNLSLGGGMTNINQAGWTALSGYGGQTLPAFAINMTSQALPAPVTSFSPAQGATGVSLTPILTWSAAAGATSYDIYFGTSPSPPFVTNTNGSSYSPAGLSANTTYYWYLVSKNAAGSAASAIWSFTTGASAHPAFFTGENALSGSIYYLQFPDGNLFGYYSYLPSSILYHFDLGYEAFISAPGGQIYLYDFTTGHWWYSSATLFPYLYDFTLGTFIYYFPDSKNVGHYTTNPRFFANLETGKIFSM